MDYRSLFLAAARCPQDCDLTRFCDGLREVVAGSAPPRSLPTVQMLDAAVRALLDNISRFFFEKFYGECSDVECP